MTSVPNGFWDESIFDELEEKGYSVFPERPAGCGVTVLEYAEKANCSPDNARTILDKAVKANILVKIFMRVHTKRTAVFLRPSDLPPE